MRLAIVTTHPIQYYAPVFKLLHQREKISIKVFYTWGESAENKYDPGFEKKVEWDIPMLNEYPFEWVKNISKGPGTHSFKGINNPEIINQIVEFQPDAVLVFGWAFHSHLKVIRYFKNKIPVLFRGDSTLLDERKNIKALLRSAFLKWIYHFVDHAFYVGINNKAYFKKYGLKENQLTFAPHAIDNKRFALKKTDEVLQLREQFRINDNELLVLFAGKFEMKKAPIQLLVAFLNLKKPFLHLLYVGSGPLEKQLKLKAKDIANVHFMDFQNQSQMPVIFQACDLFCLPSTGPGETWGLSVNEAMACGKAILVSDKVGCAVDLVKDKLNGSIFESGNLNSFTEKLQQLTANKNLLIQYGEQSRKIIEDWNFTNIVMGIENRLLYTNSKQFKA